MGVGAIEAGETQGNGTAATANGADKPSQWTPWGADDHASPRDHELYTVGSVSPFNTRIVHIYGRARDYLVYVAEKEPNPPSWRQPVARLKYRWARRGSGGTIAIHFNPPLPEHMLPALQEFRRLAITARIALNRSQRRAATELLAVGLNHAFTTRAGADALTGLGPAQSFITFRAEDAARSNFLAIVSLCSIVTFAVLYYLKYVAPDPHVAPHLREIILGGMAGILGATISMIQRSQDLKIDPLASKFHKTFHGVMRVMLGLLFGAVVVVIARSEFAFGLALKNPYALFFLALVGGFSERLVPTVISRTASEQGDETDSGK